jgi:quinol monooxygenase YgiN
MGMIVQTLRLVPVRERRSEMLELLRSVQGPTMAQPGCAECALYEEVGSEHAVVLVERWADAAALTTRLASDAYRRVLAAMELSRSPPEVRFEHVSETEGMAMIERSRAGLPRRSDPPPSQTASTSQAAPPREDHPAQERSDDDRQGPIQGTAEAGDAPQYGSAGLG